MFKKAEIVVYKLLKEGGRQSQLNDLVEYSISALICLNVVLIVVESIAAAAKYSELIRILHIFLFVFFLIEYVLRVWIADIVMHDRQHPIKSRLRYIVSFRALIDLFALLPILFGGAIIDFRVFRILRLLRITQLKGLNKYTNTLTKVLRLKGAQLMSSVFIVLIFMLVSAVVVYDLEHRVQPEVFTNVLSGLWWSTSAITTIGYGDMYPITPLGKTLGSFISIFGVFLMAVPIGILTSGFFEVSKSSELEPELTNADDDLAEDDSE